MMLLSLCIFGRFCQAMIWQNPEADIHGGLSATPNRSLVQVLLGGSGLAYR